MDELMFRSSQKFESAQYRLGVLATDAKRLLLLYIAQVKRLAAETLAAPQLVQFRESAARLLCALVGVVDELKSAVLFHANPRRIMDAATRILGSKWSKRDICFGCAGLLLGGLIGFSVGLALNRRQVFRYMKAVQCVGYTGIEAALFVDDAVVPKSCGPDEVLVSVRAGSVQVVDTEVCRGYGRTLRSLLAKYQYSKHDLPVTLGRDCAGIVTEIGHRVRTLDVGDEVWLTTPVWSPGTLSQYVVTPECNVARKPKNVSFEGACSLPYAGCTVLRALRQAGLDETNAKSKRVLVESGCTPAGLILLQLLNLWGCDVTTTCSRRAVPVADALGARDVIVVPSAGEQGMSAETVAAYLLKELALRETFDAVVVTGKCPVDVELLYGYCADEGRVVATTSKELLSDSFDGVMTLVFGVYLSVKYTFQKFFRGSATNASEFGDAGEMLESLRVLVERGHLKTVVEKVFHPVEIEFALRHIESDDSIGSTVVTFR